MEESNGRIEFYQSHRVARDSKRPHEADRVVDIHYIARGFGDNPGLLCPKALNPSAEKLRNHRHRSLWKTIKKGKKVAASNMATHSCLTIDVFDEDDGLLDFPEEPIYVKKRTLRSGTQLPGVQPTALEVGAYQALPKQTASPDGIKYNVMAESNTLLSSPC